MTHVPWGTSVPTAIDLSSVVGLAAVGMFTAQILLGLLLSLGYNPVRRWPRRRIKLFTSPCKAAWSSSRAPRQSA